MAQWNDAKYAFLANLVRNVDFLLQDPNEVLDEDKIKRIYAEDLLAYGAFGSAVRSVTASGTVTLLNTDPIFIEIDPNGSDRDVTFPAKGDDNHGYFVHHTGAANTLTLKRSGGATITTLVAAEIKYIKPSTAIDFSALTANGGAGGVNPNVLINGGFRVAQRGAGPFTSTTFPANNDDTYLIDGCILLSDGNDIVDVSQVADANFSSGYKIRLDVETANKKFGVLFPVENKDIQNIRKSGKASVQFKVKCTGASMSNVRAYLLSWSSTADAITSDVVNGANWGAAGAEPTFAANWTAENAGANLPINTVTALKELGNIAVDTAGVTNLALLIMVDDTDASVGDFLEIGDVKIESGEVCTDFVSRPYAEELAHCMRYLYIWYQSDASNGLSNPAVRVASAYIDMLFAHPVEMRSAPTLLQAGSTAWAAGVPSGNQIAFYNNDAGAFATITGALTISYANATRQGGILRCTAATSFSGSGGNIGQYYLGNAAGLALSAEL